CALISAVPRVTSPLKSPFVGSAGGPTAAIVSSSLFTVLRSMTTFWPEASPVTLLTLTVNAPAAAAFFSDVAAGELRKMIELLFSSTAFAVETLPTSQPARAHGTHGAGVFFGAGSPVTMLKFGSADGLTGEFAGLPPSVRSVQYLNEDEKLTPPGRK